MVTYGWMLLAVAIAGAAVFSLIGEREGKVDVSGFGDDDLQVMKFETANDGNLSVQVRHLDQETATIKSVNLSTGAGDKKLSLKGDKDVGSIDANNFQLCSSSGNISTSEATLKIVYDGQFQNLISEGELSGNINIQECSNSSSTGSAFFNVTITGANSSVTEGETVYVDFEVNNTGDGSGAQEVNLTVNNSVGEVDNKTIGLDSGGNTTGTFNWKTSNGDAGDSNLTVRSEDDSSSKEATVNPAPTYHWVLNAGSGATVTDIEGGADGTINGDATWTSTAKTGGEALKFDGTGDYISTPANGLSGELTLMAWVKPPDISDIGSADNRIVGDHVAPNGSHAFIDIRNDEDDIRAFIDDDSVAMQPSNAISGGKWYHVALTHDGTDSISLLVNNSVVASGSDTSFGKYNSDGEFYIGRRSNTSKGYFNGIIDDVRVYNESLSTSEIDTIYSNTK